MIAVGCGVYSPIGVVIANAMGGAKKENLTVFARLVVALTWPLAVFFYGLAKVFE